VRWASPGTLRIDVEDSGIGMDPAEIDHLFEEFTQADTSASLRYGGTGLGLALSRRFAELLGGHIQAQSAPGGGSKFTLEIQAMPATAVKAEPSSASAEGGEVPRGARILLVEDDRIARFVVEQLLAAYGCETTLATDGEEAVQAMGRFPFDVVLMDCQMPRVDGYEATRRIRRLEEEEGRRRTPIVALTASVMHEDAERTREAGMDDFMPKPVDPARLQEVLRRWIPRQTPEAS
jgi:CheY-like chemotaxis protein